MESEEELRRELEDIAPGFPKQELQQPPTGYFENFPDQILNQWKKEGSKPFSRKISWLSIVAIAAMVTGLSIGALFLFTNPTNAGAQPITSHEAYQYIHENIDDFEDLIENTEITIEENLLDIPAEELEEYLLEEIEEDNVEDLF